MLKLDCVLCSRPEEPPNQSCATCLTSLGFAKTSTRLFLPDGPKAQNLLLSNPKPKPINMLSQLAGQVKKRVALDPGSGPACEESAYIVDLFAGGQARVPLTLQINAWHGRGSIQVAHDSIPFLRGRSREALQRLC